ncbi:MAG: trypsin-like peptidase domain-containing protein [Methylococcales bacterium]
MKTAALIPNFDYFQCLKSAPVGACLSNPSLGFKTCFLVCALCLLTALPVYAESVGSIQQHSITTKRFNADVDSAFLGAGVQAFDLNLPTIQIDLNASAEGAHKTGVVYQLPKPIAAAQLFWERVNGGYVARVHLFSEQAKRLRYHLLVGQVVSHLTFRVQGNENASVLTPVDSDTVQDGNIWLPVTNGNQADLEIFADATTSPETLLSIDAVSVIVEEILGVKAKNKGYAEQKEYDLACAGSLTEYSVLEQAASATALISFVKNGSSYVCTGTLLNDKNSSNTPWFATANHCIGDQSTANTATFEWFFQATSCGGSKTDGRYAQTYGGAKLLWSDSYLEGSFLKLNAQPPNGVTFMGWDTNIQVGEAIWGVHHPSSDHTMVSFGKVTALGRTMRDSDSGKIHFVNRIDYIEGGTEQGSSGSGLFSIVNGAASWKGTLFGGPGSNYQASYYSNFDSYYPYIKTWLEGSANTSGIDQLYSQYSSYFGRKSGGEYICYVEYTCQRFDTGKLIAINNTGGTVYWFNGVQWWLYK